MIIRSKAPLRIGLAGGGTDVSPFSEEYGGYVLNVTINMYAHCTLILNNSNKIIFKARDCEEEFISEKSNVLILDGHMDLYKAIYNRIVRDFNKGKAFGCEIHTYSDAPVGSGLGSSSTMVVAIIKSFVEALSLPLGEYEIAHLAYEIERNDARLQGGKQDQYAATFGGFNFMEFYKDERVIVNPLRIKQWVINELEESIILYYTGISRHSAEIIKEQSNNSKIKNEQTISALLQLKEDALRMKEALLTGNIEQFARMIGSSWENKKKTAKSISNGFLDRIYDKSINAGAISGKISGAGGGGFMFFIVDPIKKRDVIKVLENLGGRVYEVQFTKLGTQGWRI